MREAEESSGDRGKSYTAENFLGRKKTKRYDNYILQQNQPIELNVLFLEHI